MANIKDIAKMAGVSVTTVSRVLNHHPYVKEEKRTAVLQAIEQLHYARNQNAVHLVKGKTKMIAVILPYVNNPYFSTILEGVSAEALASGYHLILCQTNYHAEQEMDALNLLKTNQVDGVIILSRSSVWNEILPFTEFGPVVACEKADSQVISSVYVDHYRSFSLGMSYLVEKGHRRIGYCVGRKDSHNSLNRKRAYCDTLDSIGEPFREEWIFDQCLDIEAGVRVVHQLLAMKERPTALLVASDHTAAGIVTEARKQGLRVPEDLAVVGFDNQPIADILNLTTIEMPINQIGTCAFRILHQEIMGEIVEPKQQELPFRLVERSSV